MSETQEKADAFVRLFAEGVALLRLTDQEISKEFGVSLPTITRWRNGTTSPHPAIRRSVYAWLAAAEKAGY